MAGPTCHSSPLTFESLTKHCNIPRFHSSPPLTLSDLPPMSRSVGFLLVLVLLPSVAMAALTCAMYADKTIACSDSEATVRNKKAACVFNDTITYCAGYAQVSSVNKNPVFVRYASLFPFSSPSSCPLPAPSLPFASFLLRCKN